MRMAIRSISYFCSNERPDGAWRCTCAHILRRLSHVHICLFMCVWKPQKKLRQWDVYACLSTNVRMFFCKGHLRLDVLLAGFMSVVVVWKSKQGWSWRAANNDYFAMLINLTVIFLINQLVVWSIKHQKMCENAHHNLREPKMTSFVCSTNSVKPTG